MSLCLRGRRGRENWIRRWIRVWFRGWRIWACPASIPTRLRRSISCGRAGMSSWRLRRRAARVCATTCPSWSRCSKTRTARALYLYPTKALAQDQQKKLAALTPDSDRPRGVRHAIFDGDRPRPDRAAIRRSSNIVINQPGYVAPGHPAQPSRLVSRAARG